MNYAYSFCTKGECWTYATENNSLLDHTGGWDYWCKLCIRENQNRENMKWDRKIERRYVNHKRVEEGKAFRWQKKKSE